MKRMKRKKHAIINIEFLDAVKQGKLDDIEMLIEEGADINTIDINGQASLHYAASNGYVDVVKFLLEKGADVDNEVACRFAIPIHIAAYYGYLDVVKLFVEFGVDPNTCEPINWNTPLHEASKKDHFNVAQYLIENGANIHAMNKKGIKPIHTAVCYGSLDVVKLFVEYGVDPNTRERSDCNTLLHEASKRGNLNVAQYLLENGANIDAMNNEGKKPIHTAAENGHKNIIAFFLGQNISIDEPDENNQTPLHYATIKFDLRLMRYLVNKGANINCRTTDGTSPLCIAARRALSFLSQEATEDDIKFERNDEIIDFIIAKGGGINNANEDGLVPLHYAVMYTVREKIYYYLVKKLVDAGAKADMPACEDRKTPLHYACDKNYVLAVEKMMETKPNLDIQDNEGNTPLHVASKHHYTKIMKCLLEAGARSDIKDNKGYTALYYYIFNFANYDITYNERNPLFAKEILGKINNFIDIDSDQKRTAAHIAVEGTCDIEFLKLVLEKQNDVNIEDINGNTALNKLIEDWFSTRNNVSSILSDDNCIEAIRLFIYKGAYLKMIDCQRIIAYPSLCNTLFTDAKLCTQAIVNKYNNKNLPILYELLRSVPLPLIEKMKLNSQKIMIIKHAVESEIKNDQYCDISKMKPLLCMLSLESCISHCLK